LCDKSFTAAVILVAVGARRNIGGSFVRMMGGSGMASDAPIVAGPLSDAERA
jgi:hypothetical protein